MGERVIVYIDQIGRLEGRIVRAFSTGFAITIAATDHGRNRIAARLSRALVATGGCYRISGAKSQLGRRKHDDSRPNRHSVVQIDNVLIGQTNAAGRNILTNGPWLIRAVDPIKCVLVVLPEVEGAGSERIHETGGHAHSALYFRHHLSQLGPALNHFLRRIPIGPLAFGLDGGNARPREPFPTYPDPVANGLAVLLHEIKKVVGWIDYGRAARLPCIVSNDGAHIGRIKLS